RIARLLTEELEDQAAARRAWETVRAHRADDEEALRWLLEDARRNHDADRCAALLEALAPAVETTVERVDLLLQRAELLATRLGRRSEAIDVTRTVVDELDPEHLGA